jgi:methylglutaconyl-CoA hydratase
VTFVVKDMPYEFLLTRREGTVEYLTLNRPDVRNSFNEQFIAQLTAWADTIAADDDVRCVVMAGAGKTFSAGADIAWMSKAIEFTHDENVQDANAAERMYRSLDTLPVPLIGRVHGAALGGGAGLAAICDIVVAEENAVFGFTEVKLGILPAVISPYVLAKIGRSATRELFLTGMRFDARRAREIGLVHAVVAADQLDATIAMYINEILANGPGAIAIAKALIPRAWARGPLDAAGQTAEAIAAQRVSGEGQEGLRAFLERRKAKWDISE